MYFYKKEIFCFILPILLCSCDDKDPENPIPPQEEEPSVETIIVFEDNFEQTSEIPDVNKWELCRRGSSAWNKNNSESYDQAYVKDGKLVLVAEKIDGSYKTGAVQMLNKLGFEHCKVEVSARFTSMAQGGWPAIWMMPAKPLYSGWPQCGEIDIMEHLNHDRLYYIAMHSNYIDNLGYRINPLYTCTVNINTNDFNVYGMEWNDDEIIVSLNGVTKFSYPNLHLENEAEMKQWPFNTDFYLILNHALGGAGTWPGVIVDSQLPAIFEVDWVKIVKVKS